MTRAMPEVQPVFLARVDLQTTRVKGFLVDGDTFILERLLAAPAVKEGEMWIRPLEVDTAETSGATLEEGLKAAAYTKMWLSSTIYNEFLWPLILQPVKKDSFGRWLSYVWDRSNGRCLNDDIIEAGLSDRVSAMMQLKEA